MSASRWSSWSRSSSLGHALTSWTYFNSLIVLTSFLAVLALGQGAVILTGGLDLSVPWTIGLCGILLAGMVKGSDAALLYALPLVLLVGAAVGFVNGAGIVLLGVSPIVMTLAINGILQGVALVYSNGTPDGFSSPLLRRFMTDHELPVDARRRVRRAVRRRRGAAARQDAVRAAHLRDRQRRARGGAVRRAGRPHADRRLYAVGALLGDRRRAADRLFGPGEPRHGRRISVALDRRRGDRRRAHHRRARPLSRHARRRACC